MPHAITTDTRAVAAVDPAEQAATIAAMRPARRPERPVIAIIAWNRATEVSDFLSVYGVLKRADVADVTVVAERAGPVRLYPSLSVRPEATIAAFDRAHPEGADYVVVPAMDPGTDPVAAAWIAAQHKKGAQIVSVCNGSRMVGTAGLLEGRRATGHWSAVEELSRQYPTMRFVPDRRYVADRGVTTSTGITANVPTMLALVEAIGGREAAARTAAGLGVTSWDARHRSDAFRLTLEHRKTFIRNTLAFWRHERIGVPVEEGVDEVGLGFLVDAYGRTQLSRAVTIGGTVRSRHGLILTPDLPSAGAHVDAVAEAPPPDAPATVLERELPRIADRYGPHTAAIVALVMEYPWAGAAGQKAAR
jgi:transcriptional regulator GlxA family with amidase domain